MEPLIKKAEEFVYQLFIKGLPENFFYHNFEHTQFVVNHTKQLIRNIGVSENDANCLIIAAWFHDTGYIKNPENHEEESGLIATEFLNENRIEDSFIEVVNQLILATKFNKEPENLLQQIIKDADCAHFANDNYKNISNRLRKEWELTNTKHFSDLEWIEENIKFFTEYHTFYTEFAKENWQQKKEENLERLKKLKRKFKAKIEKEQIKDKYKTKYKNESPERGIQTFYRVALRNHISLSDIADTKANILLSVNAIIISLVLSNLISKLDNPSNHYLIVPTIIFTLCSIISMVLSVLATRPNVTTGKFNLEDVKQKKVNLIFFGNFHQMKLNEYEWAINELINDKDYLYDTLTKDLYFLGKVLHKKYKLLRITYTWFIIGIIISVIAFAVSFQMQAT